VFAADYGTKWPKAAAKITDDLDVLLAFYDYLAEHWIHLRTTNPIESTFATVRLRQRVTKGPGSRAAGVAMAFKLIERPDESSRVTRRSSHPSPSLPAAVARAVSGIRVSAAADKGHDRHLTSPA
jgi:transposase-like protein